MKVKVNRKANFWSKLLSRVFDFILVAVISLFSVYFMINKNPWSFKEDWLFYFWCLETIALFFIFFILIPFLTKGWTVFNFVFRIKINPLKSSLLKTILMRELFFSVAWSFVVLMVMIIINHTLIIKFSTTSNSDSSKVVYEGLDALRVGIISTIGSIIVLIQLVCGISGLVRKDKRGIHDLFAQSEMVFSKRFDEIDNENNQNIQILPIRHHNAIVEWEL